MRDLEAELDLEQRRGRDSVAENKKLQKQLADLRAQAEDDHRMVAELSDQVTTLQMKIITMKRQLDDNVRHITAITLNYCFSSRYLFSRLIVFELKTGCTGRVYQNLKIVGVDFFTGHHRSSKTPNDTAPWAVHGLYDWGSWFLKCTLYITLYGFYLQNPHPATFMHCTYSCLFI